MFVTKPEQGMQREYSSVELQVNGILAWHGLG
jgi:hypothetical protein